MKAIRKIWVVFLLLLYNPINLKAQQIKNAGNEVHLSNGILSDVELIAAITKAFKIVFSGISGELTKTNYRTTGPFIAGYKFYASKNLSIGPELNIVNLEIEDQYTTGEMVTHNFLLINMNGRCDIHYLQGDVMDLYSGLGVGGTFYSYKTNSTNRDNKSGPLLSYQLNLIGLRYGKKWAGFAELGFGRNGVFNFGLSGKF